MVSDQIPLDIVLRDEATLDQFLVGHNRELVHQLQTLGSGYEPMRILITAVSGAGKTHLLQAASRIVPQSIYLPLSVFTRLDPAIFEGLASCPLVCIDDLQVLSGDASMQLALFTLINELTENCRSFIFAADRTIEDLDLSLQDLQSRLQACVLYRLELPDDDHKRLYLKANAQRRGMQLGHEAINWILTHTPRDMDSLILLMNKLDQESLRRQCKVTIPLIKQIL